MRYTLKVAPGKLDRARKIVEELSVPHVPIAERLDIQVEVDPRLQGDAWELHAPRTPYSFHLDLPVKPKPKQVWPPNGRFSFFLGRKS